VTGPAPEDRRDWLGREAFVTLYVVGNHFEEQLDALCREEGISHPQYSALWVICLSEEPAGVPMGSLADGLLHRAADTTRLVDRLVTGGLVTRTPSSHDRRVVLVKPTPRGRRVFENATTRIKALHREQFGALTQQEIAEVTRLLNKAFWSGVSATTGGATLSRGR
jgi:DNA-binding MarR family transcriptional regulator